MKGFKTKDGKFHPIKKYKMTRSKRDTKKNQGIVLKKRVMIIHTPKTQEDKNKVLSSVLGSKYQFTNSYAGETEAELWFTAKDQLKRRGREGSVDRKEFQKWLDLGNRKKRDNRVDPDYGLFIANGYDDLKHDPNNPEVKKAYEIFIKETLQQARKLQKNGMKFQMEGYKDANAMFKDVEKNKNLLYRPSNNDYKGAEDHPMFQLTNIRNTNGDRMRVNDVFRAIHDINGHDKAKAQFTPEGELSAYIKHKKLYSNEATRALFTETQGQGMWVNFNKKSGKKNRHLQKIGDFNELDFPKQKAVIFSDGVVFG